MKITWEIMDDLSHKKIVTYSETLKIELVKEGPTERGIIDISLKPNAVNVIIPFPGTNNLGVLYFERSIFVTRLKDLVLDVKSSGPGEYEIFNINFSNEYIMRTARLSQGFGFQYDVKKNTFYFGIGETNATYPYLEDVYVRD